MRFTWNAYYVLLYLYRCFFSVLAQVVVLRITAIPDSTGYQAANIAEVALLAQAQQYSLTFAMQANAGLLTRAIAAVLSLFSGGSAILINIGFQSIAFVGILLFLRAVEPSARRVLAVLLMFPSFTLWTSITSKEAIVVCLLGILAKHVIDIFYGRDRGVAYYLFVLLPVCAILFTFKPHFLAAIVFVFGVAKVGAYTRKPATLALLAGAASLVPLYLFRDPLDAFAQARYMGVLREPGNSNRSVAFLAEKYDTFLKAPEGMLRAFFGPTLAEATDGVLHLISFIESSVLIAVLVVFVLVRLPRTPVYMAILGLFTVFWIVFANYPLGLANPGTAVRYRADYVLLVYLGLLPLLSRGLYVRWRQSLEAHRPRRPPIPLQHTGPTPSCAVPVA